MSYMASSGPAPRRGRRQGPGSAVLTPPTGIAAVPDIDAAIPEQRTPETVVAACACGHARAAHEHYRPGADCGACGAVGCAGFRPAGGPIRRALRRLGLVG